MPTNKKNADANQVLANATSSHETAETSSSNSKPIVLTPKLSNKITREARSIHAITHAAFFFIRNSKGVEQYEKYHMEQLYQILQHHECELFEAYYELKIEF